MKEKLLFAVEIACGLIAVVLVACYFGIYFLIKPITGGQ
jgi:hypothetical protein